MDYDFITTCNWTSTGTFTLSAYRGGYTDIASSVSLFYRKKGATTWTETTNGQVIIASTGEWEIANDWNKSGDDCLTHSYLSITAINNCTDVGFNETTLGNTIGNLFMHSCWNGCSNLVSMPVGFNIPSGLVTIGNDFLRTCWLGCSSLTSMPSGFNMPSGLITVGSNFLYYCWHNCTLLSDDGYTEDMTFEFTTGVNVFGGTCPIITASPIVGTKLVPVNIAVNRPVVVTTRGFYLKEGSTGDPTASDTVISESGEFGLGTFSIDTSTLTAGTDYRAAVFVTNNVPETYVGDTVGFTTKSNKNPNIGFFLMFT